MAEKYNPPGAMGAKKYIQKKKNMGSNFNGAYGGKPMPGGSYEKSLKKMKERNKK